MKIKFISTAGQGFNGDLDVEDGSTVLQVFERQVGGQMENYTVRINRQPVAADAAASTRLNPNDRVSVAPAKVAGA